MTARFGAVHPDAFEGVPEPYQSTLAFLWDLWDQVGRFREDCHCGDEFVFALLTHLEEQLVALSVVLVTKAKMNDLR